MYDKPGGHKRWCDFPSGPCDCGKSEANKKAAKSAKSGQRAWDKGEG